MQAGNFMEKPAAETPCIMMSGGASVIGRSPEAPRKIQEIERE